MSTQTLCPIILGLLCTCHLCIIAYVNGHRPSRKTGKLITVHMSQVVVVSLVVEKFFLQLMISRPEIINSTGPETKQQIVIFNGPKAISLLIIHPLFLSMVQIE